ncbi:MAG: DMT family transporter [Saprospiraceae bacterium]|nr:DMT family transporter [Saprospiraceae bacterium]
MFAYAQTEVSSSLAGLLNSLTPIWTLIIGILLFRLNFSNLKLIGVVTGFVGAGMLILMGNGGISNGIQWQSLLIVAATVCYGSSVNMVQAFFGHTKPVIISSMSFFVLGIPALIWLFTTDFLQVMAHDPQAKWSLGTVGYFSTTPSTVLWPKYDFYYLVQKTSAVFGSTVTYLMPVVALAWGIFDGETITILHIAGLCLILVGVYFTKKS